MAFGVLLCGKDNACGNNDLIFYKIITDISYICIPLRSEQEQGLSTFS